MIKINLPDNFTDLKVIQDNYSKLAKKIYAQLKSTEILYQYNGITTTFESETDVKRFLLAPDFDSYKFREKEDPFLCGLYDLSGNCSIKNIVEGVNGKGCPKIKEFAKRFPPKEFKAQYDDLRKFIGERLGKYLKECGTSADRTKWKEIERIFSYDGLNTNWRHEILCAMDVPVCPYCNMNYTINYELDDVERSTADVDHFYLKSQNPEYALCLYNFIPACPVCNSRFKGNKTMRRSSHIYPFEESYRGKARFEIKNVVEMELHANNTAKIQLTYDPVQEEKVKNSEEIFKNSERYEQLHGIAEEMLEKVRVYTEDYGMELRSNFSEIVGQISVKDLVFGQKLDESEYARVSLGKFRMDLLQQLGVFPDEEIE